jgi:hypothetical protein
MISDSTKSEATLTPSEQERRNGLALRKPYVAQKLANISEMEDRGEISPIIRIEKSYLCNFQSYAALSLDDDPYSIRPSSAYTENYKGNFFLCE